MTLDIDKIKQLFPIQSGAEVYVLLAIARKKNNPNLTNRSEKTAVFREVVKSGSRKTSSRGSC